MQNSFTFIDKKTGERIVDEMVQGLAHYLTQQIPTLQSEYIDRGLEYDISYDLLLDDKIQITPLVYDPAGVTYSEYTAIHCIWFSKAFLLLIDSLCQVVPPLHQILMTLDQPELVQIQQYINPLKECLEKIQTESGIQQLYFSRSLPSEEAPSLFFNAVTLIFLHEFSHCICAQVRYPARDDSEQNLYEKICDEYAVSYLEQQLIGNLLGNEDLKESAEIQSICIGAILGMGSLLLIGDTWKKEPSYPNTDSRVSTLIERLKEYNPDLWLWGRTLILVWATINHQEIPIPFPNPPDQASFESLTELFRSRQPNGNGRKLI